MAKIDNFQILILAEFIMPAQITLKSKFSVKNFTLFSCIWPKKVVNYMVILIQQTNKN
uniref:Uncharacterized protein n=1 Tax=Rhizophagus irregularis (strain DAOM 181602 / DAOM 197198 / MUCL 43194) TaxID=747089 RepID=U9UMB5_RHIID